MKGEALKNATEAHGWLGVITSVALFIIFWAGSITLFHAEISRWAKLPHFPIENAVEVKEINTIVESTLAEYDFDSSRELRIRLPDMGSPYMEMRIPVFDDALENIDSDISAQDKKHSEPSKKYEAIVLDPHTGETLFDHETFHLADFIYELHYNLKLPMGLYIVGCISLFFLVIVLTGLVIQAKKLVKHFFLYRHNSTPRKQTTDIHNVVGVISLPFSLMYALTGVMLNLGIVSQIATVVFLYQGDRDTMFKDAGFFSHRENAAEVAMEMPDYNQLIARVEHESGADVDYLMITHYGDQNAIIRFRSRNQDRFASRLDTHYKVSEDAFLSGLNLDKQNAFSSGITTLYNFHYANFAGLDIRFLYFILGLGVCGMIVVGNILWIVKREKRINKYKRSIYIIRALTLGACVGVVCATAFAFLLERVLPVGLNGRASVVEGGFYLVLLGVILSAWRVKCNAGFIAKGCFASAIPIVLIVLFDCVFLRSNFVFLWQHSSHEPLAVTIGLLLIAFSLVYVGLRLNTLGREKTSEAITV